MRLLKHLTFKGRIFLLKTYLICQLTKIKVEIKKNQFFS